MDVEFLVTATGDLGAARRPVIGVDGPVQGAHLCFDHHATGEPVNLLAVPDVVPVPGTIATTMLDGDAVISAAVVFLRALGEGAAVPAQWEPLYEAAHYCDHLVPSGRHPAAERAGLGLHCWLKDRGFTLGEVLAWAGGELEPDGETAWRPALSDRTRSRVFEQLTLAVVTAIRRQALPCDFRYLERLDGMAQEARSAIDRVEGCVTVLRPARYVDPLALYRVVDTDLVVIAGTLRDGASRYSLGVHPRAYGRLDLRPALRWLDGREPGWGGRSNAGGSPPGGSRLDVADVVVLLNELGQDALGRGAEGG